MSTRRQSEGPPHQKDLRSGLSDEPRGQRNHRRTGTPPTAHDNRGETNRNHRGAGTQRKDVQRTARRKRERREDMAFSCVDTNTITRPSYRVKVLRRTCGPVARIPRPRVCRPPRPWPVARVCGYPGGMYAARPRPCARRYLPWPRRLYSKSPPHAYGTRCQFACAHEPEPLIPRSQLLGAAQFGVGFAPYIYSNP